MRFSIRDDFGQLSEWPCHGKKHVKVTSCWNVEGDRWRRRKMIEQMNCSFGHSRKWRQSPTILEKDHGWSPGSSWAQMRWQRNGLKEKNNCAQRCHSANDDDESGGESWLRGRKQRREMVTNDFWIESEVCVAKGLKNECRRRENNETIEEWYGWTVRRRDQKKVAVSSWTDQKGPTTSTTSKRWLVHVGRRW